MINFDNTFRPTSGEIMINSDNTFRPTSGEIMINFDNTFRPLPSSLTIRDSGIEGVGVFATEDIPAGSELGNTRLNYHGDWIRTPLGGFINHSDSPNCVNRKRINQHGDRYFCVETFAPITSGDEITLRYTMEEYSLETHYNAED